MKNKLITRFRSILKIEVEGYFVERFINLCKLNNIEIWNIQNLTAGKITAYIYPRYLESIKPFLTRTKCSLNILDKKGVYFWLVKYKKRKIALCLCVVFIFVIYIFSNFIWKIQINGNNNIPNEQIISVLNEIGIKNGIFKNKISTSHISDFIRSKLYEVAWVGVTVDGTTLSVEIVEKNLEGNTDFNKTPGNIIAGKDAIITKIVADNGTAKFKVGSYISSGQIAIEGCVLINGEEKYVHASGYLRGKTEYIFEKEYYYLEEIKENYGKLKYGISFGINDKKIDIKHLPKDMKYDINSSEKNITIFGITFSVSLNKYTLYNIKENVRTKEELIEIAKEQSSAFLYDLECMQKVYVTKNVVIEEYDEKIIYRVKYIMEEDIAKFIKTKE